MGKTELVLWFVEIIFVEDEGMRKDISQESGEGCFAAGGTARYADYYGFFVVHCMSTGMRGVASGMLWDHGRPVCRCARSPEVQYCSGRFDVLRSSWECN